MILEEIKMDEDNPDYLVHEIFTQNFWKDHPLGKPILGTKDTVKKFERSPVLDFYKQRFTPGNIIVSQLEISNTRQFVDLVTTALRAHEAGDQRLPCRGAQNRVAHHVAKQESAGAGADLHGRAFASDRA